MPYPDQLKRLSTIGLGWGYFNIQYATVAGRARTCDGVSGYHFPGPVDDLATTQSGHHNLKQAILEE